MAPATFNRLYQGQLWQNSGAHSIKVYNIVSGCDNRDELVGSFIAPGDCVLVIEPTPWFESRHGFHKVYWIKKNRLVIFPTNQDGYLTLLSNADVVR